MIFFKETSVVLCAVLLVIEIGIQNCVNAVKITDTLDGQPMRPITTCPDRWKEALKPNNIHVLISVTQNHMERSKLYIETVQYYSVLHGYNFRVIDPTAVLEKYGTDFHSHFKSMRLPTAVLNLKGLITLCTSKTNSFVFCNEKF